jgi:hypothetical protein
MGVMGGRRRGAWRWALAVTVAAALVIGLGFVLRAQGIGVAADVAQLVALVPIVGWVVGWAASRRASRDSTDGEQIRLAELLRTIADAQGLTGLDVRVLIHGWSGETIDAFLAGKQLPEWDFVVAFLAVVAGNERWRRELLERRVRPVWEAAAKAPAVDVGVANAGALVPLPARTGNWVAALRRVADTSMVSGRAQESVSRHEILQSGLEEVVRRLSEAVSLLGAERDALLGELAVRQNDAFNRELDREMRAELEELRAQLQDSRRRLATAERLRAATGQRLAESERQLMLAERLKTKAIAQAEEARARLAELELHPAPPFPRKAASRDLSAASTASALMGDTDTQVGDEILCRADNVLREEAATLGRLSEDLSGTSRAKLFPGEAAERAHNRSPESRQAREKLPEPRQSLIGTVGEWFNTGTAAIRLAKAVLIPMILFGIIAGDAIAGGVFAHSGSGTPASSRSSTGSGGDFTSPSDSPPQVSPTGFLTSATLLRTLLPAQALGSAAKTTPSTKLSLAKGICGAPVSGAKTLAAEYIKDNQTHQSVAETIIEWDKSTYASEFVADDHKAVDKAGSCSYTSNNETTEFEGDYSGSLPSSCLNPGRYLATQVFVTSSSLFSPGLTSGFYVEAQCGIFTITIQAEGEPGYGISQVTADGYLSNAVGHFAAAVH